MKPILRALALLCACLLGSWTYGLTTSHAQVIFDPPKEIPQFPGTRVEGTIELDGKLDEPDWLRADTLDTMFMKRPMQNVPATERTVVRVLWDDTYLYVGGVMYDSQVQQKGLTVVEMSRDFGFRDGDLFGVAIDGLLDRRNAAVFQVNPYGAIRDLQSYDDRFFNRDWNALWYAKTQRTNFGWTAEIAIPWESLRYPKDTDRLGIIFTRNVRRLLEENVWPAVPRNFTPYRMNYAADLTNISPPDPGINIQFNPYALGRADQVKVPNTSTQNSSEAEFGGELKWAINSNAVLDVTVNTDFAQADIDQQVVNLARFNVLFPERRQFFLENSDLFDVSGTGFIQPFFSRRIGLDASAGAIPILAGSRLVRRGADWNAGAMLIAQDGTGPIRGTEFGVFRYAKNFGQQNRIGFMSTLRNDRQQQGDAVFNATYTTDWFIRFNQQWFIQGFLSLVDDSQTGTDLAGRMSFNLQTNQVETGLNLNYVGRNYNPRVGFLGLDNFINVNPFAALDLRPQWLPKGWRRLNPGFDFELMMDATRQLTDQAFLNIRPFVVQMDSDTEFGVRYRTEWQHLQQSFMPLNLTIAADNYIMESVELFWRRDPTATLSWDLEFSAGEYYNGQRTTYQAGLTYLYQPFLRLGTSYERNVIRNVGVQSSDVTTDLYSFSGRLALSPTFNVNAFYQRNTFDDRDNVNIRLSWEYQPLSFLFVVLNESVFESDPLARNRITERQAIAKLTWMRQF